VKSHFTCIDESYSSNIFLLNSLHLLIEVNVNRYVAILASKKLYSGRCKWYTLCVCMCNLPKCDVNVGSLHNIQTNKRQ
jgi:hypothetical protein